MGKTDIEWTHRQRLDGSTIPGYTWNLWWGCSKVSAGCKNCYAEGVAHRFKGLRWGARGTRHVFSWEKRLQDLRSWDASAKRKNEKRFVFVNSMSDFLEDHSNLNEIRDLACASMPEYENLVFLVLTKRPENAARLLPLSWFDGEWPSNVWIGASVEDQTRARVRIPALLSIPAPKHFLSIEPMLGPVWLGAFTGERLSGIDWVIAGGESGSKARPPHPEWFRSLRGECAKADVPFFFKQWGKWGPSAYEMSKNAPVFRIFSSKNQWINKGSTWVGRGDACVGLNGFRLTCGGDFDNATYPVAVLKAGSHLAMLDGEFHRDNPLDYEGGLG